MSPQWYLVCIALLLSAFGSAAQQQPIPCRGSAELPLREEQSIRALKAELLAAARLDAMGRVRGTDIASIQTSLIASGNPHDSGMSDSFRSFSQSLIAGRWAGDADLPLFTPFIGRDGRPWMRAEVSGFVFPVGYERNIAKCFISLSGKSEEQTVFREGDAFTIHIESGQSGRLDVFIESDLSDTVFVPEDAAITVRNEKLLSIPPDDGSACGNLVFTGNDTNGPSVHRFHFLFSPLVDLPSGAAGKKAGIYPLRFLSRQEFYELLLKRLSEENPAPDYEIADVTVYPR